MKGISEGTITPRGSLTPAKASEYISGQSPKSLPEKKKAKKEK